MLPPAPPTPSAPPLHTPHAPHVPHAPHAPGLPRAPIPKLSRAASVLKPEAQEEMISNLQREGVTLEEKIREIKAARSQGGHAEVEYRVREEQMAAKGALISKLQEDLATEVNRMEQGGYLKEEIKDYEARRAALKLEIQQAKALKADTDGGRLRDEVLRAEERCRQLQTQLQRLEANSYLSKADDRKEANMRHGLLSLSKTGIYHKKTDACLFSISLVSSAILMFLDVLGGFGAFK